MTDEPTSPQRSDDESIEEESTTGEPMAPQARSRRGRREPSIGDPWSADAARLLAEGEFVGAQALETGSNYTFAVALADGNGADCIAIYKPVRGEAPLWDFPTGTLYRREYCAYVVSQALGWPIVPPTVIRDGPAGVGSLQFFLPPSRRAAQRFSLPADLIDEIRRITLFDHLTNNADRKRSHLHIDKKGKLWGIDHGLTFHAEWKLRTVVFDFVGEPIPEDLLADLVALRDDAGRVASLRAALAAQLDEDEVGAFFARLEGLLAARTFPILDPQVNWPRGW
jgi:uncharacterized repeat protein (TIGR03843 family)